MVERMLRQVVDGQCRLFGVGRRKNVFVFVIDRAVLCEKFRRAVARVVRVREAEVDQEWFLVFAGLAIVQVVHHLIAVPDASRFISAAAFCCVMTDRELLVGTLVAVASLTGSHRAEARLIEDSSHRALLKIRWAQASADRSPPVRKVPHRAATHDHVTGRRADGSAERTHVISPVQYHAFSRQPVDIRRIQPRVWIVNLQIKRRLIVDDDEQDVRPFVSGGHRSNKLAR